jgi:hypothetical protein
VQFGAHIPLTLATPLCGGRLLIRGDAAHYKNRAATANDEVLAGKVAFRARERCWPVGVPGFDAYSLVEPFYFYQTPEKVVVIAQNGPEVRHIYLNVMHSKDVKPSWYGESVGHYENGDTLVIDTIGISAKSFVDNYRTPHTDQLHVVERWKFAADGKTLDVSIFVEDPGAFTTPWTAVQRWRHAENAPIFAYGVQREQRRFLQPGAGAGARSDEARFLITVALTFQSPTTLTPTSPL